MISYKVGSLTKIGYDKIVKIFRISPSKLRACRIRKLNMIKIPNNEIKIKFIRSSGPGGQNVNRRATKAQLCWNINDSTTLTDRQKELLRKHLSFTNKGDIIIESDKTRYQRRNKELVIIQLNNLINKALKKRKKRISTKPSKAVKEKRLEEKRQHSEKKKARQRIKYY